MAGYWINLVELRRSAALRWLSLGKGSWIRLVEPRKSAGLSWLGLGNGCQTRLVGLRRVYWSRGREIKTDTCETPADVVRGSGGP